MFIAKTCNSIDGAHGVWRLNSSLTNCYKLAVFIEILEATRVT